MDVTSTWEGMDVSDAEAAAIAFYRRWGYSTSIGPENIADIEEENAGLVGLGEQQASTIEDIPDGIILVVHYNDMVLVARPVPMQSPVPRRHHENHRNRS